MPLLPFFSIICAHELFKGFERWFPDWAWLFCRVLFVWHCGVEFSVVAACDAYFYDEPHVGGTVRGASEFGTAKRLLLATGITDEIFAVAMSQKSVTPIYFLGLSTLPYFGWSLGTMVGAICGEILPAMVTNALGVALYGMFVAIVVPQMKSHGPTIFAVAIAVALSCAFKFFPPLSGVSVGFAIIICALVASLVAAALFPMKMDNGEVNDAEGVAK